MVNYQNGKIYRIVCNITGKQYIGSTTENYLCNRLRSHVGTYKTKKDTTSREVLENGNYSIILIENSPCNNKDELLQRERYFIESMECVNKHIPGRTDQEWRKDNKEIIKKKNREYHKKNYKEINEKRSVKITCECGCLISKRNIIRHKKTKKHLNNI